MHTLQPTLTLNLETKESWREYREGWKHMAFVAALYERQVDDGKVFIHEQTKTAKSWALGVVNRVMNKKGDHKKG